MADTSIPDEFTLRFDGERLVVEEKLDLPVGVPFRVRLVETDEERKARPLQALKTFGKCRTRRAEVERPIF